jgi:hypothetical protein
MDEKINAGSQAKAEMDIRSALKNYLRMKNSTQLLINLIILIILAGCNSPSGNSDNKSVSGADTAVAGSVPTPDINKLTGTWIRTDGGKTIVIKNANPDGWLDAEYLNPNPIHVSQALWLVKDNSLIVVIDLQDVNYPGSRYTLEYLPAFDELAGVYYQAVDKVNFEVGFVRQK